MILNLLKNLIMALLLDAGAAFAFHADGPAPAAAPAPQSCLVPLPAVDNLTHASANDTHGTRS